MWTSGRTTALRAQDPDTLDVASTVELTDPQLRSLAASDPIGFVASLKRPALSDPWRPASDG